MLTDGTERNSKYYKGFRGHLGHLTLPARLQNKNCAPSSATDSWGTQLRPRGSRANRANSRVVLSKFVILKFTKAT